MPVADLSDSSFTPPTWADALRESARLRRYDAHTYVFNRGQRVESVYQVQTGQVFLRRDEAHGGYLTLQTAGPGDFVAETSLFTARYHCDAFCGRESELLALSARTLLACLEHDPLFAVDWIRLLSRQLVRSRAREERLTLRSPRDRVLHCLRSNTTITGGSRHLERSCNGRARSASRMKPYIALAQLENEGLIVRDGILILLTEMSSEHALSKVPALTLGFWII